MQTITSKDGTKLAYTKIGTGPALVLVDGALCHRHFGPNSSLAALLAKDFTVYTYDRRGRGESGDNATEYESEREIEDLEAVIDFAGSSVYLYGISSGGGLVLEATNRFSNKIKKLALFEIPYITNDGRSPEPADYVSHMKQLISENRRGETVEYFMKTGVGLSGAIVFMMKLMPGVWSKQKSVAHTLIYDAIMVSPHRQGKPLTNHWPNVTQPVISIDGGKSPAGMRNTMRAIADVLPNADYATLPGQTHIVKAPALAPVLTKFFTAQ